MPLSIPAHKLPSKVLARRAMLAAKTGLSGVKAEAIADADAHTNNVGLPTYSELLAALRNVLDHSGHIQPIQAFAGDGSVKGIRRAGQYMDAICDARSLVERLDPAGTQ